MRCTARNIINVYTLHYSKFNFSFVYLQSQYFNYLLELFLIIIINNDTIFYRANSCMAD